MKQLKMQRPTAPVKSRPLPAGWRYELYRGTQAEVDDWVNICRNGLIGPQDGTEAFERTVITYPDVHPLKDLFFVVDDTGRRVATTAAVKHVGGTGYVHMVASLPETRGKGVGHAMLSHTLAMIEARGVSCTTLTTDDFRLAAVKTYLDAGFLPVLYEDPDSDMKQRWNAVLDALHYPAVDFLNEQGDTMLHFNEKVVLEVGANAPFSLLHLTDTHIALADEQDCQRKHTLAKERYAALTDSTGVPAADFYREAAAYANRHGLFVAHTGDLFDFTSHAHCALAPELLALPEKMLFATGNHEFSQYVGEAFEDENYRAQSFAAVQAAFGKHNLNFSARVVNGVNLIAMDNGYYYVTEEQFALFRKEAEKGLPMILFVHTPFYSESLRRFTREEKKLEPLYTIGTPVEEMEDYSDHRYRQQITTPLTRKFLEYMYSCENLKAVVAGHLHKAHVGPLKNGIPQVITGALFQGEARVIEVR